MNCERSGLNESRGQGDDCFIRNAIAESVPVGTVKEKAERVFIIMGEIQLESRSSICFGRFQCF